METVMERRNLTKPYHSKTALDNLDLTLPQGRSSACSAPTAAEDHLDQAGRRS